MNPRHTPFMRLLVPWIIGILLGAWINKPVPGLEYFLYVGILWLFLLARRSFAYRYRWVFGACVALLLTAFSYYRTVAYDDRRQPEHLAGACPDAAFFVGTVYDAPSKGVRLKIPLRLEAAGTGSDDLEPCVGNVLLFFPLTPATLALRYGDRLWVRAAIRPTSPPGNPHAFDYQRYLRFQNIHYQAFVRDSSFGVSATGLGHPLWRMAFRWREHLLTVLHTHFPGTDEFAVASALLVGYKDDLSEELRTAYAETGSMHALAVSGTHVGLLYSGLLLAMQRLPWSGKKRRWGETILILLVIWAFTLITGATASVLRASVMFSVFVLGKAFRRQASVWNIVAASAFGLLGFNPYMLFDAGFQLSYAAVAGMVFFLPHFQKQIPALPGWLTEGWNILLVGVAAQLGTLPLSLYYFHQFPVYFWLSGWVVVLGGAVFLWGGAALVLLQSFATTPAAWLGWLLHGLVWSMNRIIAGIQQLPGSVISGIWVNNWATVLLYVWIGLLAAALLRQRPRWLLAALAVFAGLAGAYAHWALENTKQQGLVVYQVNRHCLVDFFDGATVFTYSDTLGKRAETFAAQANRWARGMKRQQRLPVEKSDSTAADPAIALPMNNAFESPNLYLLPPLAQFYHIKIAILDGSWPLPAQAAPVPVAFILITGNPRLDIQDCLRQFPTRLVVLDASNSPKQVAKWASSCKTLGVTCHDVREAGSFEYRPPQPSNHPTI